MRRWNVVKYTVSAIITIVAIAAIIIAIGEYIHLGDNFDSHFVIAFPYLKCHVFVNYMRMSKFETFISIIFRLQSLLVCALQPLV